MRSILFWGRPGLLPAGCLAAIGLISSGQTIKQQTTNLGANDGLGGVASEAGEAEKPQKLRDGDQIQKLKKTTASFDSEKWMNRRGGGR